MRSGKRFEAYCERQSWFSSGNVNYICVDCRTIFKQPEWGYRKLKCPNCEKKLTFIGIFAKVPRKIASNSKWKKFFKNNYIDVEKE